MIQTSLQAKTFEYKLSGQEKTEIKTRESDKKQDKNQKNLQKNVGSILKTAQIQVFIL